MSEKQSEARQRYQAEKRAQRAFEVPLHPNEQTNLREQARQNVLEDIATLMHLAKGRADHPAKRASFVGRWESFYLREAERAVLMAGELP